MSRYLIIMGVQGAGKGTQASYISEKYGIPHVSTGDLFRAMKTREDELARKVQDIMASGNLVSDEVTNEVLLDRLQQPDAQNGVILDGYPRNIAQAKWLENQLKERGAKLDAVLLLELDPYTAFKRAYGRVKSAETGETYNFYFNDGTIESTFVDHPEKAFPPRVKAVKTDTGEVLQRRADDEAGSVVKRIDTYLETTRPLIDYYDQKGLVRRIQADQPIDMVSEEITTEIDRAKV